MPRRKCSRTGVALNFTAPRRRRGGGFCTEGSDPLLIATRGTEVFSTYYSTPCTVRREEQPPLLFSVQIPLPLVSTLIRLDM